MKTVLLALLSGIIAGGIDVLPMVLRKMDKYSILSAFIHWVIVGLILPYLNWNMHPTLKGMLFAILTAIPIMLLVAKDDLQAVIPILLFSLVLGASLGFVNIQ
jgi:phosphate starvation-inducible membrane PsiE